MTVCFTLLSSRVLVSEVRHRDVTIGAALDRADSAFFLCFFPCTWRFHCDLHLTHRSQSGQKIDLSSARAAACFTATGGGGCEPGEAQAGQVDAGAAEVPAVATATPGASANSMACGCCSGIEGSAFACCWCCCDGRSWAQLGTMWPRPAAGKFALIAAAAPTSARCGRGLPTATAEFASLRGRPNCSMLKDIPKVSKEKQLRALTAFEKWQLRS